MSVVQFGTFGKNKSNVYTFSVITTTKKTMYEIIWSLKDQGWKFWDTPNITKTFKTYHVKLQLYRSDELEIHD